MVGAFRRSISFPAKQPGSPPKPPISTHNRSVSLPTRTHPIVSQLKDSIAELKAKSAAPTPRTAAWLTDCLTRLRSIHDALDDALQVPHTQSALARYPQLVEKLLEDFLHFVDIYGTFQTLVLSLKEEQTAAQVAIRKRDEAKVGLYAKSLKKTAKEIQKLVSTVKSIQKRHASIVISPVPRIRPEADALTAILNAVGVTVTVSLALFNGISESFVPRKSCYSWAKMSGENKGDEGIEELQQQSGAERKVLKELRKMKEEEVRVALKKMEELEGCIAEIESGSGRVFRSLINTRVSLLNALTN